eukprot:9571-Heterococcus_DN1.PRE.1
MGYFSGKNIIKGAGLDAISSGSSSSSSSDAHAESFATRCVVQPRGWIPREQILGGMARRRVPPEFIPQYENAVYQSLAHILCPVCTLFVGQRLYCVTLTGHQRGKPTNAAASSAEPAQAVQRLRCSTATAAGAAAAAAYRSSSSSSSSTAAEAAGLPEACYTSATPVGAVAAEHTAVLTLSSGSSSSSSAEQ